MAIDVKFFSEGMHSDNDVIMQPENTYRKMINGNIMNLGGNRFSIELTPGNIVSFSLPNNDFTPIGFISFVSFLAVISTNNNPLALPAVPASELGIVSISPSGSGVYQALYHHLDLNFSVANLFEGHGREENQYIKRGYFTDNNVAPKVFNFADKVYTTYFPLASLVTGDTYMVLSGSVEMPIASGNFYGPGQPLGTVFTKTTAILAYYGATQVIKYVPIELLDWIPKKSNGEIRFKKWKFGGNVESGMYQFAYQLEGSGGIRSGWSYVTKLTHIVNSVPANTIDSYQTYIGSAAGTPTGKIIELNISEIDTFYTKIRVAVVRYSYYNLPNLPELFYDGYITGSSMDIDYLGGISILKLTAKDLQAIVVGLKKVKTVASFKNRNFPANLTEFSDVLFEPKANVTIAEYIVPSDLTNGYPTTPNVLNGHPQLLGTGNTAVYPMQWYKVLGPAGSTVTYNGIVYGPGHINGDVFQGIATTYPGTVWNTPTGTPTVIGILHISKYGSGLGQVFKDIPIENDWADSKGMTVQTHLGSYWRGETARLGLLLFDPIGNPLFVKWLADKAVEDQYQTQDGINLRLGERYNNNNMCLRHIGFNISGLDFNDLVLALRVSYDDQSITLKDIPNYISGFSIVRAERSETILAQGILFPVTLVGSIKARPSSTINIGQDKYFNTGQRWLQTYVLHSPEITFGWGSIAPKTGDYLKLINYITDTNSTSGLNNTDTTNHHYYCKAYNQDVPGAATPLGQWDEINPDLSILMASGITAIPVGGTGSVITFDNLGQSDGAFTAIGDRFCVGCKTRFMILNQPEGAGNFTYGFGAHSTLTANGFPGKMTFVNWIRPNDAPYGGTSSSAKANTLYGYTGHYQKLDSAFMSYLITNNGIANNIEVFGGDAYVSICDLARNIKNQDDEENNGVLYFSNGVLFPVESNINLALREGRHLSKDRSYEINGGTTYNTNGIDFSPSQPEQFTYNAVFSSTDKTYTYVATPIGFTPNSRFEKRARYSSLKLDGEIIDSFRQFAVNNLQEAEGINGQINNLILGINHLFYLQDRGVGYFPIQERETITGALGTAVQLGVGGIMDRFDNISNFYGNQHQWGVIRLTDRFAWFDMRNRVMLMMSYGGGGVTEYSIIKGLEASLTNLFDSIELDSGATIFNSDEPMLNRGIASGYDPKYKMGLMTFKFTKDDGTGFLVDQSITIGLNKTLDKFIGWYDFCPGIWIHHAGQLLAIPTMSSQFKIGHTYVFGEQVSQDNINYVCILGFTASNNGEKPLVNPTNFKQINSGKQIFVSWRGKIGQFFGKVYNHLLQFVVNKDNYDGKVVDTIEVNSSTLNYDKMRFSVDNASVIESTVGNKNYKYFDGSWQSSVPLAGRIRLADNYLLIEGIVENFDTDPSVSLNKQKSITSVKATYRIKK